MENTSSKLPISNYVEPAVIRTSSQLGQLASTQRKLLNLNQLDIAGMANTGNRFIVDLEKGKPTVQLQKALDVLDLLGLEVVVRPKSARTIG